MNDFVPNHTTQTSSCQDGKRENNPSPAKYPSDGDIVAACRDRLEKASGRPPDPDGTYSIEILADAGDRLSDEEVVEICRHPDPLFALWEKLDDIYSPAEDYVFGEIWRGAMKDLYGAGFAVDADVEEKVREYVCEHVAWDLPVDDFLKQEICVDILIDAGDANYDFVPNCTYPHYNADPDEGIDKSASILWLARNQGYTEKRLRAALLADGKSDVPFLEGVRAEILNHSSSMAALVFLARMTLAELINLSSLILAASGRTGPSGQRGHVLISKDAVCGLFDPWDGAGGLLEIRPDRDVRVPVSMIHEAVPDSCLRRYGVMSVYGAGWSLWRPGALLAVRGPAALDRIVARAVPRNPADLEIRPAPLPKS